MLALTKARVIVKKGRSVFLQKLYLIIVFLYPNVGFAADCVGGNLLSFVK